MFLEWTVSSHNRTETQLFSSGTVSGTSYQQIINLTATLTFIKTSNRSAVPLVSILIIDNATSLLNGTNVTCMESARDHRDSTESTPSTIHVVDPLKEHPVPPDVTIRGNSEFFGPEDYMIILEWTKVDTVSYCISIYPQDFATIMWLPGRTSIQVTVSYNIQYNVSVEATLCGHHNKTTVFELHYVKCGHPLILEVSDSDLMRLSGYSEPALVGSNITFNCATGLILTGPNTITCNESGLWEPSPSLIKCQAICRTPVSNSSHNFTVRGSLLTISCGADEDNKYTATCHFMNATWAPDPGEYCSGVNVGPGKTLLNDTAILAIVLSNMVLIFMIFGFICGRFSKRCTLRPAIKASDNNSDQLTIQDTVFKVRSPTTLDESSRDQREEIELMMSENVAYSSIPQKNIMHA